MSETLSNIIEKEVKDFDDLISLAENISNNITTLDKKRTKFFFSFSFCIIFSYLASILIIFIEKRKDESFLLNNISAFNIQIFIVCIAIISAVGALYFFTQALYAKKQINREKLILKKTIIIIDELFYKHSSNNSFDNLKFAFFKIRLERLSIFSN